MSPACAIAPRGPWLPSTPDARATRPAVLRKCLRRLGALRELVAVSGCPGDVFAEAVLSFCAKRGRMQDSLAAAFVTRSLPMAAEAFVQCRVTAEIKTLLRVLAEREKITESALVRQLL